MSKRGWPKGKKRGSQTPEHTAKLHTPETNAKRAATNTGRTFSPEHCNNISISLTGKKKPPRTPEYCAKQSDSQKIAQNRPEVKTAKSAAVSGSNHPNWMGGISKLPYAFEFDNKLKEQIRERDNYTCQKCNTPQAECKKRLPVHHIDYNKKNSDPVNLITLCVSCNSKVNKNRKHWTAYFQAMVIKRDVENLS